MSKMSGFSRRSTMESILTQGSLDHETGSQWELLMRRFSNDCKKNHCKSTVDKSPKMLPVHRFPTGSTYEGTWNALGMNGHGVYTFPNGVIYEGNFENGDFHGEGELRYPDGNKIIGVWWYGQVKHKTVVFADGTKYTEDNWKYCHGPDRRDPCLKMERGTHRITSLSVGLTIKTYFSGTRGGIKLKFVSNIKVDTMKISSGSDEGFRRHMVELLNAERLKLLGHSHGNRRLLVDLLNAERLKFAAEYTDGIGAAESKDRYLTPTKPPKDIPEGWYDTCDGLYDPETKTVFSYEDHSCAVRSVTESQHDWITKNCRSNPERFGPCPDLYKDQPGPELQLPDPPSPPVLSPNKSAESSMDSLMKEYDVTIRSSQVSAWNKRDWNKRVILPEDPPMRPV